MCSTRLCQRGQTVRGQTATLDQEGIILIPRLVLASVCLCVSMGLGQTAAVTTIPYTDPSIVYTGVWYTNSSPSNSGGITALTNAINAQADRKSTRLNSSHLVISYAVF